MDIKMDAKKKVLEEIMKLMDEQMGEGLKAKSPKAMMLEVEAEKPEEMPEMKEGMSGEDDMSDEDMMRLKDLYEKYR
jgi:hypothetical protein